MEASPFHKSLSAKIKRHLNQNLEKKILSRDVTCIMSWGCEYIDVTGYQTWDGTN